MTIEFIRHAQTAGNVEGRYVGSTDMPVSEVGLQAALAGHIQPEVRQVYVTPLQRTQQTASALFPNARQDVLKGFREMSFGTFEGRSPEELKQDQAFIAWNADGGLQPMEGGEGRLGFAKRVMGALEQLVADLHARGETHARLVCHGGVIMALMMQHALPEKHWRDWWVENLTGYRVVLDGQHWGPGSKFISHETLDYGPSTDA